MSDDERPELPPGYNIEPYQGAWAWDPPPHEEPSQQVHDTQAEARAACWAHFNAHPLVDTLLACDAALCDIIDGNYAVDRARAARKRIAKTLGVPDQVPPIWRHDLEVPKT